jgi:hypothetical protein
VKVRDLPGWPPNWQRVSTIAGGVPDADAGILTRVRWDPRRRSLALTMEYEGERHVAVLEGETGALTRLYLLLGWHIGRALGKVGGLEVTA